jgi:hypothetical protein
MATENLGNARRSRNDEFYTQYHDIEKEMNAYLDSNPEAFIGKTVLLPCDDPEWSNFTRYFAQNFERLGLKKLISTSYAPNSKPEELNIQPSLFEIESPQFDGNKSSQNGKIFTLTRDVSGDNKVDVDDLEWSYLEGTGDFRSDEVKALRDDSDIIITNPPFSLFREFLAWIMESGKQFAIIGNMNAITYKEVFPLIMSNSIWLGATNFNNGMYFTVPVGFVYAPTYKFEREQGGKPVNRVPGVCWFTNLDHGIRHLPLVLMTEAHNTRFSRNVEVKGIGYKRYDNFDAIEVPTVESIPSDYEGIMGVPKTFLGKYNPQQFEILGNFNNGQQAVDLGAEKVQISINGKPAMWNGPTVDGIAKYSRILIRHRKVENEN